MTGQKPQGKIKFVGLRPWDPGGHDKGKDPVNGYKKGTAILTTNHKTRSLIGLLALCASLIVLCRSAAAVGAGSAPSIELDRRLVDVGEPIKITLTVEARASDPVSFVIFPRYLENCDPRKARGSTLPLVWLDAHTPVEFAPVFQDGRAELQYTPDKPGNYMARLRVGNTTWYRYFAAVTKQYLVYRMEAYGFHQPLDHGPLLRNGGFPIDWVVADGWVRGKPPEELLARNGHLSRLLEYQEQYGDLVMPGLYEASGIIKEQGASAFKEYVEAVVGPMRKTGFRVDRAVNDWAAVPPAVAEYSRLGFDVIDGIIPEGEAHRGAPWFPYWMSPVDCLSPSDGPTGAFGMIMDFCAGFHFHGPPDFHMAASRCNWQVAAPHADLAAREHCLIAGNSGSGPVFVPTLLTLLYNRWTPQWPTQGWTDQQVVEFDRSFLDDTAFEHARKYPIVFARCVDIADYLRRHPAAQPRRVLSSVTRDWLYDQYWSPEWCNAGVNVHRGVLPFNDSLAEIRKRRTHIWAKPTSRELIYYEDSRHQCRFEYACPKPMLWYAYDDRRRAGEFLGRPEIEVPDPQIGMETRIDQASFQVTYRIRQGREFPNYKLAVWDIPREFANRRPETNASEFILIENSENDYRGILVFDLKPEMELRLRFVECRKEEELR